MYVYTRSHTVALSLSSPHLLIVTWDMTCVNMYSQVMQNSEYITNYKSCNFSINF
jgi:hypothetical protein